MKHSQHLTEYEHEIRADERAKMAKHITHALALVSQAEVLLKALKYGRGENSETDLPTAMIPKKRAAVSVTPEQLATVYDVLDELSAANHNDKITPKMLRGACDGIGLKTIAAACRQLVAEGRAIEVKRGAYRAKEKA